MKTLTLTFNTQRKRESSGYAMVDMRPKLLPICNMDNHNGRRFTSCIKLSDNDIQAMIKLITDNMPEKFNDCFSFEY